MKNLPLLLPLLILPYLQSCGDPKAHVFEDDRLSQEESVKICLIGDLGRGTEHQQEMAEALEREECNRIFFLGDLVYPKGIESVDDPALAEKFLNYYLPLLQKDPNLIIGYVLGNHDHKLEPAAWKEVADRYPGFFFPNYFYMVDYGGLCIVGLDTSFYYYPKLVVEATKQSTWLTRIQPRLKKCEIKVAITHHPLRGGDYDEHWSGATGPLKAFLETYVIGKFDMHIAGHVHALADDGKDEGTKLLISGTGGENLSDMKPGYVVLNWDPANPKRIGYSLRRLDMEVKVVDETGLSPQEHEAEEKTEHMINRRWVEKPWWAKILSFFGIDFN